jgi:hypothetical protein
LTRWDPIVEKAIMPFEEAHMCHHLEEAPQLAKKT